MHASQPTVERNERNGSGNGCIWVFKLQQTTKEGSTNHSSTILRNAGLDPQFHKTKALLTSRSWKSLVLEDKKNENTAKRVETNYVNH